MEKTFVGVRDVDEETYRKFKALAVKRNIKLSEAFKEAVNEWAEKSVEIKEPNPRNLLKIKPIRVGSKKVRWSEEIDEFLYGLKK